MAKVYPVPELVLDDYIRVDDTGSATEGSMDNTSRIMRVPLLDNPACRHVRAHEMAHAKYSPKKPTAPKGVHQMIVQRVEDMRMNLHCRKWGLDEAMDAKMIPSGLEGHKMWGKLLSTPTGRLTAGIATYATGDHKDWERCARPSKEDLELIQKLWDELQEDPSWETTQRLSKLVSEYLDEEGGESSPEGSGDGSETDAPVDLTGDILDEMVDQSLEDEAAMEAMSPFEKGVEELKHVAARMSHRGNADIIEANIVTMPLVKRMAPSKFKSRAKVAADRGMRPQYMNRYCSDKAIFVGRGKKRDKGGTIIIDCSGSMGISGDDIDRAMEEAPLGTIATYNGRGREGEIRIIAKNGRRAISGLRPNEYGNLVDVAALEWAVRQAGPYYWVCDGVVSGADPKGRAGEVFGKNIFDRCIELVEKHEIIMVPHLESLPQIMRETL